MLSRRLQNLCLGAAWKTEGDHIVLVSDFIGLGQCYLGGFKTAGMILRLFMASVLEARKIDFCQRGSRQVLSYCLRWYPVML
jgi:hypothetical protein